MLVLDVKRTKEDFLKKKGKSSVSTLRNYKHIFTSIEKFCLRKYDSSLENIIEGLAITPGPQEQVENMIQTYIDELETEGKPYSTVLGYSTLAINYLKYRRVKFDKDELQTSLSYKSESKQELYPITKKDIQTLLDHASFEARTKILLQSGSGFRISELLSLRKSDINTGLERYTVKVRAECAKNGIERTTIISREAMSYLDKILESNFEHQRELPNFVISATCIDSGGHYTDHVINYCDARKHKKTFAIKGSSAGYGVPIWPPRASQNKRLKKPVYVIGVNDAKETLMQRLRINESGAGYWHFPIERDAEWFAQITSEIVKTKYVKGRPIRQWQPRREGASTEGLDCRVYAFAALRGLIRNWKFDLNKTAEKLKEIPLRNNDKQSSSHSPINTRRVRKVRSRGIS